MQYFIGIVPPESELEKLKEFRKQWPANRIDDLVEPHITLKAQGGLSADEGWLENVKAAAADFPAFRVQLAEPRFFGEDVLYLSMDSPEVNELHSVLVEAVGSNPEQIAQYFELDQFVAHLTLAKTSHGVSQEELKKMAAAASQELAPYPDFQVDSIRIYRMQDEQRRYEKYLEVPLKKMSN
ncbi:2'-5' RNA ligase family protein [Planomicrobium okeanokoites]|uniref:2'-5' RNA ligase family protein n=1 Tax=Planomicrobium okeanokoites TaxID=244 RepID=A0ABV7KL92_PLAOK|nr:2'-5' RNA ligase family protein [Planomicrobium okeanokoites]TAA69342.1 2'-5' RNA ligase family protein [Planomicrobium okeanokoites]